MRAIIYAMNEEGLKDLKSYISEVRSLIETHWSSELLFENFKSREGDSKSAGFCGPSSIYLWQELQAKYPDCKFSLAVGRVYQNSKEWIRGKHVWVVLHIGLRSSIIIDITADQSRKINQDILVESVDDLAKKGINYIPYNLAKTIVEVNRSPISRASTLREKVGSST